MLCTATASGSMLDTTHEIFALGGVPGSLEEHSAELVRRAKSGDPEAFRGLYDLHKRMVARTITRLTHPSGDLDDAVQEVFVQVFRSLESFRGESRFSTWLHRVTVNVVLMLRRAARCRPSLGRELQVDIEDRRASPHEEAARNERLSALYDILDKLSDKKRTVFILHDLEGMSAAEVAEVVDAPVLTVRTRLFYARHEVMERMARSGALGEIAESLRGWRGRARHGHAKVGGANDRTVAALELDARLCQRVHPRVGAGA